MGGGGGWSLGLGRGRYLVQLVELDPLLLRAAASDRRHVQHPVTKLHEGPPERRHTESHDTRRRTATVLIRAEILTFDLTGNTPETFTVSWRALLQFNPFTLHPLTAVPRPQPRR